MLVKFTSKGKFLLQIGGPDKSRGNADQASVNKPADAFVYQKTNELFVADGYGNRRVIVFDADTGAFKRMWGAFGNAPVDAPPAAARGAAPAAGGTAPAGGTPPAGRATAPAAGNTAPAAGGSAPAAGNPAPAAGNPAPAGGAPAGARGAPPLDTTGDGSPQFGGPVHSVKVSNDGIVYVADRPNRRIQLYDVAGKYQRQMFINRPGPSSNSVAGLAFSPDRQQRFLYVADYGNSRLLVVERATLEVLYQFGGLGEEPGRFRGPHHVAADSKGNLYVVEVSPGNRAQRFVLKGLVTTPPPDALK